MATNLGSLRKILELEQKKGYLDSAVIGGLDKFLSLWLSQFYNSINDSGLLKRFSEVYPPGTAYALMSKTQRKEWTSSLLISLDELEAPQPPKTIPALEMEPEIVYVKHPSGSQLKSNRKPTPKKKSGSVQSLDEPIVMIKGINEALSKKFAKLGVATIRDLLYFFPHRHVDYSQRAFINNLAIGQENTIIANVWEAREVQLGTRRSTEATVGDESGNIRIVWFNRPYLARSLKTGSRIIVSGKVSVFGGMPVFESPEWEPYEDKELVHTGRWVPIYPLTQGLAQRSVRRILKAAIDQWSWQVTDFLPEALRSRLKLLELSEAISQAHYPENEDQKNAARRRLAFDELFLLQLGVLNKKRRWQEEQPGPSLKTDRPELNSFLNSLPYKMTTAQNKSLQEILNDMGQSKPMSRLLQGEVGSGKTVVATAAMILAVADGYQGALMAPTEILASQHFHTMRQVLSQVGQEEGEGLIYRYSGFLKKPLKVAMLMGDLKQSQKRQVQERVASGEIDIVIGTHALIQKGIEFHRLGLVVVDEQHRFGVEQRSALRHKGTNPHVLVMTATPIPRTLALTLYGDLDLSVINELPPGRQTIKTKWLRPEQREAAYRFLMKQVKSGHQAFIICPLVEESDVIQARAAVEEYEQLSQEIFPDLRLGLLHGRMPSQEKDTTMRKFAAGELDILVSTPVVEVGIDVPNATAMLIESADRFGLSQLHQFRGRIGRGKDQSYCMLLAEKPSDIGIERLSLIERTSNGFLLAEEDLKLRGPGEFFGTRQSGLPDLKMARLTDVALLELARNEAIKLFREDPELKKSENQALVKELSKVWRLDASTEWS